MTTYVTTISSAEVAELITEGPDHVTQVVVQDADENGGAVAYTLTPGLAEVLAQFLSYAQDYTPGDVTDTHADYLAALGDYDALLTNAAAVIRAVTDGPDEGAELSDSLEWTGAGTWTARVAGSQSWAPGEWRVVPTFSTTTDGRHWRPDTWTAFLARAGEPDWVIGESYPSREAARRAAQAEEDRGAPSCGCGTTHWSCPA